MSIDKRQHVRQSISLKVRYPSLDEFLEDYTANISIGGCFLQSQQSFEQGQQLELTLELPDGHEIQTQAVVRWVSTEPNFTGVGVQFVVISKRDQRLIARLIESSNV